MKLSYIQPALEYFSQNCLDEKTNNISYVIITYTATQGLMPSVDSHGPFNVARDVLTTIDNLGFNSGKSDANACVSEGLATALVAFKDLEEMHELRMAKKFLILVCDSPPYLLPVMDCITYEGKNTEQLATIIQENKINLSVISPRKIPIFFKIYEKSGGDMTVSTKMYAKDSRHLVLLKGFTLSERAISPNNVNSITNNATMAPNQTVENIVQQQAQQIQQQPPPSQQTPQQPQQQQQSIQVQAPQLCVQEAMAPQMMNPMTNSANFRQMLPQTQMGNNPMVNPQMSNPQMVNPQMANQQMNNQQMANPQMRPLQGQQMMQPGLQRQPGPQQVRWPRQQQQFVQQNQFQNQPPGQQMMGQTQQQAQASSALRMQLMNSQNQGPSMPGQMQTGMQPVQGQLQAQSGLQQSQQQQQVPPQQSTMQQSTGMRMQGRERIWSGIIEWFEKPNKNDQTKVSKQAPFHVSANVKNGEPDIKADSWPQRLLMQLMPKQMVGSAGGPYLKESKTVVFHPTPCEALETLSKVMASGMAGCVHFTNNSEIKILILLYTAEKKAFLGFIPNDQVAFVDRLRKVITQSKQQSSQQSNPQAQLQNQGQGQIGIAGQNMPMQPNQMMQMGGPPPRMQMMPQEMVNVNMQSDQAQWQNQQQMMQNSMAPGMIQQNPLGQGMVQPNQMAPMGGPMAPGIQRMVRPNMMPNNPGLRHLLQQQVRNNTNFVDFVGKLLKTLS